MERGKRRPPGLLEGAGKEIKKRVSPIIRRRVLIGKLNIPIVFIIALIIAILPIGMAFGEPDPDPSGRNLLDAQDPLIEIYNVEFHSGNPGGGAPIPTYPDGTPINSGDFWLSFEWGMLDYEADVKQGDWFDVVIDLGLEQLDALITQQTGQFAPVIYLNDGAVAGTITWQNQSVYQEEQRIVIRIELDALKPEGLWGDGTLDGRVHGTGVWGFHYKASEQSDGERTVTWQIDGADGLPKGQIIIIPNPDEGPPIGGNEKYNPYDELGQGFKKYGARLTPDNTPIGDTIFYWAVFVNGHKHASLEAFQNCPIKDEKCIAPAKVENGVMAETFTIRDDGLYISPTWLRDVREEGGKTVIYPDSPLTVNKSIGLYGQSQGQGSGPAYFKLYYVNSEYIWKDRVNYVGSPYKTPANDMNPSHRPNADNPVGQYDPLFTTWVMRVSESNAVLYAPNYRGDNERYYNYLEPVPDADIRQITLSENGFEIEVNTQAVMGKTLAIAYMSKPATDEQGNYRTEVGNSISIVDVTEGPIVGATGKVLIGGTISGRPPGSPNKGKFVIEKFDYNTVQHMADVGFNIVASSENAALAEAANAIIEEQKTAGGGVLRTGADGKLVIDLPAPLPWVSGKNLVLTITEIIPSGYRGVQQFKVTIEPENGKVINIEAANSDIGFIRIQADHFGIEVWNRSATMDTSFYDVALRKWIKKVDRLEDGQAYNVFYNENVNTSTVAVKNGDVILFRIDVYNQCFNRVIIPSISDWLPAGLKFDPAATIAHIDPNQAAYNNNLWQLQPGAAGEPDKLVYIGQPIELAAWTGGANPYPEYRIPLVLVVDVPDDVPDGKILSNIARITGLKNAAGEDVEDIDSFIEDDPHNTGPVPGWDYGDDPPPGTVIDNEIEGAHKNPDGGRDYGQDEDTHDYASVVIRNETIVACEVDKDTIRRTSAAFNGRLVNPGYDNVGDETYRYDINFRSTSSLPANEFVVEDPLENVLNDQVRLTGLWTPVTWGDVDGRMNVWYKTKNGTGLSADLPGTSVTSTDIEQLFPTRIEDGWKLWAHIDKSGTDRFKDSGVMGRERLLVPPLEIADGDYIIAIRFEYGAVKVGFTTKNDSSTKLNGKHRAADGSLLLPLEDLNKVVSTSGKTTPMAAIEPASRYSPNARAAQAPDEPDEESGNFFTRLFGAIFSLGKNDEPETVVTPLATNQAEEEEAVFVPLTGDDYYNALSDDPFVLDWTPDPASHDFALGALYAEDLKPASYLVVCERAMETENIVSSAKAQISLMGLWDDDVDAVVTREIVPFTVRASGDPDLLLESYYRDNIPLLNPQTETGTGGRSARTYDEMKPLLWSVLIIVSVFLLSMIWFAKFWRRRPVLPASGGRRQSK